MMIKVMLGLAMDVKYHKQAMSNQPKSVLNLFYIVHTQDQSLNRYEPSKRHVTPRLVDEQDSTNVLSTIPHLV